MADDGRVSLEAVAVITAALSVVMGTAPDQFRVASVRPVPASATGGTLAWSQAGRLEQQLARRQLQLRRR